MNKYWHTKKGFRNPKGSLLLRGFRFASIRWIWSRLFKQPYVLGKDLPHDHILKTDEAKELLEKNVNNNSITWLGHASFLMRINGINILTDPLLFGNPGPSIIKSLSRLPSPLQSKDFNTDVLLLSHEHPDHVHHPTLRSLRTKKNIQPVTPLGLSNKIKKYNFKKTVEIDWFEEYVVNENVTITAVPAVHYSDFSNTSLWSGFIISFVDANNSKKKIYFGGDSGYGEFFKHDIAPRGPFELALIGIGAFDLPFKSHAPIVHTTPEQAIRIAQEINAKNLIGMHWGTMRMADEDPTTLFPRARQEAETRGYTGSIIQIAIGETISLEDIKK